MKKIKRFFYKDKYGIVRSCVVISLLVVLCASFAAVSLRNYDRSARKIRARDAAIQAGSILEHIINSKLESLEKAIEKNVVSGFRSEDYSSELEEVKLLPFDPATKGTDILTDGSIRFSVKATDDQALTAILPADKLEAEFKSIIHNDYGYGIYDRVTGAWILNCSGLPSSNFYEFARSKLTESQLMEPDLVVDGIEAEGEICYLAQHPLSSDPSAALILVIPSDHLQMDAGISMQMPLVSLLGGAFILVILIVHSVLILRRIRNSSRNTTKALMAGERLLDIATGDARAFLLVYHRSSDRIFSSYDGLHLGKEGAVLKPRTLAELAEGCGMSEDDFERLQDAICKLDKDDRLEMILHCPAPGAEERTFCFTAYPAAYDEKSVLLCICDCTLRQAALDRAEDERKFQADMRRKASSIWEINVSRDRWRVVHSRANDVLRSHGIATKGWQDYTQDLNVVLRRYLHPSDYASYADTMGVSDIAEKYHRGCSDFMHDYRVLTKENQSEWHRMRVRIWLDPRSEDLLANLYVFNVDAEKNAELERGERKRVLSQSLTALGGIYDGLFYVELENNRCYTARSTGGDLVTQLCVPYRETFDAYIADSVHPDDRDAMRSVLSTYNLRKHMPEGTHFHRQEYRRKIGDTYEDAVLIVQPARFENGSLKEIVLAFRTTVPRKTVLPR